METMIEFKDLVKNYGKKEAVRKLNLEIRAGELFILVGPNGAGKTTTLKMLAGLLKPTSGRVFLGGHDMQQNPVEAKRLLSFVPDTPYIYEKLTPWELLRFVGKLYGMDIKQIELRGKELLDFFAILDVQNVLIEEFSHGMRQKAVLTAALLHDPKILVLDEPMVGLDPMSIKSLKDFLKKQSHVGMTVVLSTHTLSLGEEIGSRIAMLNQGVIVAQGSMDELQRQYGSRTHLENMFMDWVARERP